MNFFINKKMVILLNNLCFNLNFLQRDYLMKVIKKFCLGLFLFGGISMIAFSGGIDLKSQAFPPALDSYGDADLIKSGEITATLKNRIIHNTFNLWASLIFLFAIIHTFFAGKILVYAKKVEKKISQKMKANGKSEDEIKRNPSFKGEMLHFFGEVEVIFGIWILALALATISFYDWETFKNYIVHTVNFNEPMFVVVIMALASTRPIMIFSKQILGVFASIGKNSPGAWWISILTMAPLLGSFITEPAAMTIAAMLLADQFYRHKPSSKLAYATIGILFVNISVGGTITHFAAPPVLMVAAKWEWNMSFMAINFGWKAFVGIVISNILYFLAFRNEFAELYSISKKTNSVEEQSNLDGDSVPFWIIFVHLIFMCWTVVNAHYPPLFIGGFLFFLGFSIATRPHQSHLSLKTPLLVGFFLAGLVTHGGMQAWWIAPVLSSLGDVPLMLMATVLTAFNDNAAITFLSTLVPEFSITAKYAVVAGAVAGGGLTVIANAPNPAGQSILSKFFPGGVNPAKLFLGALIPTIILGLVFMGIPQDLVDPKKIKNEITEF